MFFFTAKFKKKYLNKILYFVYSFVLLLFTEITIKYTGMSEIIRGIFFVTPLILLFTIYFILIFKFKRESNLS